jgi:hypothetical protein
MPTLLHKTDSFLDRQGTWRMPLFLGYARMSAVPSSEQVTFNYLLEFIYISSVYLVVSFIRCSLEYYDCTVCRDLVVRMCSTQLKRNGI